MPTIGELLTSEATGSTLARIDRLGCWTVRTCDAVHVESAVGNAAYWRLRLAVTTAEPDTKRAVRSLLAAVRQHWGPVSSNTVTIEVLGAASQPIEIPGWDSSRIVCDWWTLCTAWLMTQLNAVDWTGAMVMTVEFN